LYVAQHTEEYKSHQERLQPTCQSSHQELYRVLYTTNRVHQSINCGSKQLYKVSRIRCYYTSAFRVKQMSNRSRVLIQVAKRLLELNGFEGLHISVDITLVQVRRQPASDIGRIVAITTCSMRGEQDQTMAMYNHGQVMVNGC
jgi:hypothetical protein